MRRVRSLRLNLGHTVTLLEMFRFARRGRPGGGHRRPGSVPVACWLAGASLLLGCTEQVRLGRDDVVPGASASGGSASTLFPVGGAPGQAGNGFAGSGIAGNVAASLDAGPCEPAACGATTYACGDCVDNDGDDRADANDPECLGPCDDSESELSTGIDPRVNGSCRSDCYFDRNAGSGDDGCSWSYRCDPKSIEPDYPPTGSATCAHDPDDPTCNSGGLAACEAGCLPLTPNGCDCFGCCELPAQSGIFVWLGSEALDDARCDLASGDPGACKACTPVPGCSNPCDECELCVGKTELPAACASGVGPVCPEGIRTCDPSQPNACGSQGYCVTGCCARLPS